MRITNFDIYRDLLKEKSGLVITPEKGYLLDSRLGPVAKKWGFATLDAMTAALQGVPDRKLVKDIVEAMTTNETFFFRDTKPFDLFRDHVLPYMTKARAGKKTLRIWCAACSSGQEPYSLAILLKEKAASIPNWKIDILATDLSTDILDQARNGAYTQFEVQRGLPIQLLLKYFKQIDNNKWTISDDIKKMIRFEPFNLLEPMSKLGTFDVVFCRNVLIYFDEKDKKAILEKIAGQVEKDGFLYLGGAETVLGITDAFQPMTDKRGIYARKESAHLATSAAAAKAAAPLASGTVSA